MDKRKTILIALALAGIFLVFLNFKNHVNNKPSRVWMEYVMDIVREKKPAPTESARFYAAVATVYYENLLANESKANTETQKIINYVYPEKQASTTDFLKQNNLQTIDNSTDSESLANIKKMYEFDNMQDPKINFVATKYNQYWIDARTPFTPSAGKWQRWNLDNFDNLVPPPPKFMSSEYKKALNQVKSESDNRTTEDIATINFWGGVPGTEQPAGIWQNRFFNETKELNLDNKKYSYIQMVLAQAVSDSFMECWKVKYQYFTKRPSMAMEILGGKINLAMPNPPFPSYLSGHSTISESAATVLSNFFPQKKDIFEKDSENAKNSRLKAGIHFPYDNEEGQKLGKRIGEFYVQNLSKNN